MSATLDRKRGRTGARVELARYPVASGDRVLYGQRVDGVVRVTDVPQKARGRAYLVERGLEEEGRTPTRRFRLWSRTICAKLASSTQSRWLRISSKDPAEDLGQRASSGTSCDRKRRRRPI